MAILYFTEREPLSETVPTPDRWAGVVSVIGSQTWRCACDQKHLICVVVGPKREKDLDSP
jgi:hypothetical protein